MERRDFYVEIEDCKKELSARERIAIKQTDNAVKLDEVVTPDSPLRIAPDFYAILKVHNEASEDKDYGQYVVVDKDRQKYVTGSGSFFKSFLEIFDEMSQTDEEYEIEIVKRESKNYKGKYFLTCNII